MSTERLPAATNRAFFEISPLRRWRAHLQKKGWVYWSPEDIKSKVEALADQSYENDPANFTAKILTR